MHLRVASLSAVVALVALGQGRVAHADPVPVPRLSSIAVPVKLPAPCAVDLRVLPDVPDEYPNVPNLDGGYGFTSLSGPPLPIGPSTASTVPAAWNNGGAGTLFASSAQGLQQDRWAQSDAQVAADDSFVVEAANSRLRVSARNGNRPTLEYDLAAFMGTPPDCGAWETADYGIPLHPDRTYAFQPSVYRDPRSGRWFVAASVFKVAANGVASGRVQLAVSTTSDPSAGYALYVVSPPSVDERFFHFPRMAVTDDKVVFAWDVYSFNSFRGSETVAVPKAPLLGGGVAVAADFPVDPSRRMMYPAQQYSPGTAAYVAGLGANGTLRFDVVDGSAPLAVHRVEHTVAVTPWTAPPKAEQPGAPSLDAGGGVLQAAVFDNGTWWGSVTEGCAAAGMVDRFACTRMWQLAIDDSGVPVLQQEFDIAEPGVDLTYPASVIDADGNLTTILSRMSNAIVPGIVVVGRAAGSPANTIGRPIRTVVGRNAYTASTTWGTYAGASLAPDGRGVWLAHQTANGPWRIEVVELRSAPFAAWASPAAVSTAPGATGSAAVSLASLGGWSGTVGLSVLGTPAGSSATLSTTNVTVPAGGIVPVTVQIAIGEDQASDFVVTVRACAAGSCQPVDVAVRVKQFAVSVSPTATRVNRGETRTSTVTVRSMHGWSGSVTLSVSDPSSTTSSSLSAASVAVPAGGSATATLTVAVGADEEAENVPVRVQGCEGFCRAATFDVQVPQFVLYPSPSTLTVAPGATASTSLSVLPVHGWTGTVALSAPTVPEGTVVGFSPASVSITDYQAKGATITVTTSPSQTSSFVLSIQGCASFCRTTYLRVDPPPPGVVLSADPSEMEMTPGSSGAVTITITSVGGYAGSLSLSTEGGPSSGGVTLSPSTVSVAAGGSTQASLIIGAGFGQLSDFTVVVLAKPPGGAFVGRTSVVAHMVG